MTLAAPEQIGLFFSDTVTYNTSVARSGVEVRGELGLGEGGLASAAGAGGGGSGAEKQSTSSAQVCHACVDSI